MNIFQGFRKLLFCVIAACTGMVVGYQLSRVLFANVRLCLGIGAVCAVILGILAFRFYRAVSGLCSTDVFCYKDAAAPGRLVGISGFITCGTGSRLQCFSA